MWALGCVVYEMLHGKAAFAAQEAFQLETKIRAGNHGGFDAGVPSGAKAVVSAMLGRSSLSSPTPLLLSSTSSSPHLTSSLYSSPHLLISSLSIPQVSAMLATDPKQRLSAADALEQKWLKESGSGSAEGGAAAPGAASSSSAAATGGGGAGGAAAGGGGEKKEEEAGLLGGVMGWFGGVSA